MFRQLGAKKMAILISAGFLLVVLAFAIYYIYQKDHNSTNQGSASDGNIGIDYSPPSEEEKKKVDEAKTSSPDPKTNQSDTSPAAGDGQQPAQVVSIISAKQDEQTGDVTVKTRLSGSGWVKCELALIHGSLSVARTSEALYQPSFSTCMGFTFKNTDFPAAGEWTVNLTAYNNDTTKASAKTITINIRK